MDLPNLPFNFKHVKSTKIVRVVNYTVPVSKILLAFHQIFLSPVVARMNVDI
jgi:hypothetical protein